MAVRRSMKSQPEEKSRSGRWRVALLLLVLVPFVPEFVILGTSFFAQIRGCEVQGNDPCGIGLDSAPDLLRRALEAGSFVGYRFKEGLAAGWLAACYVLVTLGWSRLRSRLSLAFALSLGFAVVPYAGPLAAIGHLTNPECVPNAGGVVLPNKDVVCKIYGGDVGPVVHNVAGLAEEALRGKTSFVFAIFIFYGIITLFIYWRSRSRTDRPVR